VVIEEPAPPPGRSAFGDFDSPDADGPLFEDEPPAAPALVQRPDATARTAPSFEIDHGLDPDWARPAGGAPPIAPPRPSVLVSTGGPSLEAVERSPAPADDFDDSPTPADLELDPPRSVPDEPTILSEPATDAELFGDPSLDVARMTPGEERQIVVPVEVVSGPRSARRFKLTLRLRLDPVD
jgi:hypothetical protein